MARRRPFTALPHGPTPVIVNDAFARRYFPGGTAVGRRFEHIVGRGPVQSEDIVGVIANAKYRDIRENGLPTVYLPSRGLTGRTLEVRSSQDPRRPRSRGAARAVADRSSNQGHQRDAAVNVGRQHTAQGAAARAPLRLFRHRQPRARRHRALRRAELRRRPADPGDRHSDRARRPCSAP